MFSNCVQESPYRVQISLHCRVFFPLENLCPVNIFGQCPLQLGPRLNCVIIWVYVRMQVTGRHCHIAQHFSNVYLVLFPLRKIHLQLWSVVYWSDYQCTRWGRITGPASAKWQNFVTMLFFGIKIPTPKWRDNARCSVAKERIKDVDKLRLHILTAWDKLDYWYGSQAVTRASLCVC